MLICRFVRILHEHFRAVDRRYFHPRKYVKSLNVIKEMVSAQRATIDLWTYLRGLLSTQEARVDPYASFVLRKLLRASITRKLYVPRLPFLNY